MAQGEDKGRSVYSKEFFISDQVEMKYLKIEIIPWAVFLQLLLIFVTFLVIFWKLIYETILFWSMQHFFQNVHYYLGFFRSLSNK